VTPVVRALIIANVIGYGLQYLLGNFAMAQFALWPIGSFLDPDTGAMVGFKPWQLITSAFLHDPDNLLHLLLNMFALYMFGRDVEARLGASKFTTLYFASVLAGSLAQLFMVSMAVEEGVAATVGASGGVFGVLLAFAVLFPKRKLIVIPIPIPMPAWFLVTAYAVIELTMGVFGTQQGVAHFAHLGGMVGAAIVLFAGRRPDPPRFPA